MKTTKNSCNEIKMMGSQIDISAKIKLLADDLIKISGVLGVMLFGSYARNEPHEGSDIDIAVIYENKKIARKMNDAELKILEKYEFLHQVLSFGKDELVNLPMRRSLINDGILLCSKNSETKESLLSMEVPVTPDKTHHEKAAKEKWEIVKRCYKEGQYSGVGDEAMKALEQAIEASVAKNDIHFHDHPANAHKKRKEWLKDNYPEIANCLDLLWDAYGKLGYLAEDGKLAKKL